MNKLKEKTYNLMDSFLVEGDKPRRIKRLNQDRHLFVKNLLQLFKDTVERIIGENQEAGHRWSDLVVALRNGLREEQRQNLSKILSEDELEKEINEQF